jgi:hypothetical protein
MTEQKNKISSWGILISLTVYTAYFYVFMEWLFLVTKQSFMDQYPFWMKLGILLLTGLTFSAISLIPILGLFALGLIGFFSKRWKIFLMTGSIVPAVFLTVTVLMMIDNFTYTIFRIGVVSTQGIERGIYGIFVLAILIAATRYVLQTLSKPIQSRRSDPSLKFHLAACASIFVLSIIFGGSLYTTKNPISGTALKNSVKKQPNILLIGSDGLNADHLSLYGYEVDTTPFLKTLVSESLLAENNFPNANITMGSLVSIFTSKLPTETRVIYPPNILSGANAYEHLPGLLGSIGYYNAEISVNYYLDPNVLNLQKSFDMYNGNFEIKRKVSRVEAFALRFVPDDVAYFISSIYKRLSDRVFHIYYIRTMPNPYVEVTNDTSVDNTLLSSMSDVDRLGYVKSLFKNAHQPLFVHVHLMGTHGASLKKFDNEILTFDGYMNQIVDMLKLTGQWDNTILIVYTDHGRSDVSNVRIPLMIHFPNGEYAGKITSNTQNLDIAPTILEYMGIKPPSWMSGTSLLKSGLPAGRPIFSAAPGFRYYNEEEFQRLEIDLSKVKPPFYQFGTIGMVVCRKWYALDTSSLSWTEGDIENYSTPCSPNSIPTDASARQMMIDQLKKDGFNTKSLQGTLGKQ